MVLQKISIIKSTDFNEKSVIITKMAKTPRIANIVISLGTYIITSCIQCTVFILHLKNVGVRNEKSLDKENEKKNRKNS